MIDKKPCPFCNEECDPVTDEHDNPFRRSGLGTAHFCEGCKRHWWDGAFHRAKFLLEEQPAPDGKGVISVPIVDKAQPYGFGVGRFMESLKSKKKGGDKEEQPAPEEH